MDGGGKSVGRFTLGKQSSLMPEHDGGSGDDFEALAGSVGEPEVPASIRLMYLAYEGDVEGIKEIVDTGVDVNFQDIDGRTALHVAACQGFGEVVELLVGIGAKVDVRDRWGSTPLADAIHYKNHEVIKILEKNGATLEMVPMRVKNAREVPEYEIDPKELDFTHSVQITKGTFRSASWRGIQVAVKSLDDDFMTDEEKVTAFRDELALLQQVRHPNVVQFLGAVTQSSPLMIVTEYLPKGDLRDYLKKKGALKPEIAVRFALDIARGMNYLHERKTEAVIHRDLEPSNILRDDSGHLKVADFGVSRFLKKAKTLKEDKPLTCLDSSCRYVAPEVFLNKEYDTKVDVFSFALILQEMIEGCPPFSTKHENDVPKSYAIKERPPFRASSKLYAYGLKEYYRGNTSSICAIAKHSWMCYSRLIEECWSEKPSSRPTFRAIIDRLTSIQNHYANKRRWKVKTLKCFQKMEAIWKRDQSDPSSRSSRSTNPSM